MKYDVAIVGVGAAGLFAAIFAGRAGARVVALDGAPKIGAKIIISGGGRCNVTNQAVSADDFNGNRNTVARILRTFPVDATIDFFRDAGVELKREETGKLFPVTDRARTVVDALLGAAADAGVEIRTGSRVQAIRADADQFVLSTSAGELMSDRVVIATGGRSIPKTGSDGLGYELVRSLGHSVGETFPALVPLLLAQGHWLTKLSGTAVEAELLVRSRTGRVIHRVVGSTLFTHFGLSGPAVLDVSRHWIAAKRGDAATLAMNFLPGTSFEAVDEALLTEARRHPRATVTSFLRGRLPERLFLAIADECGLEHGAATPLSALTREERRGLARKLTSLDVAVTGDRGFDYAEVTAGGVPLAEVDPSTMGSRRCDGLYLCGEILDVDGRIGGFNFQWAWATGRLAGMNSGRVE